MPGRKALKGLVFKLQELESGWSACLSCEEKQEGEHFNWLTLWHQRLLSAISEAEKVSTGASYPGWKSFKQLVLKSTEEVVQAKEVLEAQAR